MSNAIANADECARALDAALVMVDAELDVFEGILRLIAAYVPYGG